MLDIVILKKNFSKINFFYKKILNKFISPSKKYIYFFSLLFQLPRIILEIPLKFNSKKNILIWDIRSNAITFDFLYVIFVAFYKFRLPKDGFHLIIYIPNNYDFKVFEFNGYKNIVSSKDLKNRINNLILPLAESSNCIKEICILSDEYKLKNAIRRANILPRFYHHKYFRPPTFNYLQVDKIFRTKEINLDNFINPRKLETKKIKDIYSNLNRDFITLTLRDYGWSNGRNTSQRDIDKVFNFSNALGYQIILIPDDLEKIKEYNTYDMRICSSARLNLSERIYLYANSYLNINPQGGPSHLSIFLKGARTIILNFGAESFDGDVSHIKKYYNINFGEQPYLNLDTFFMWKDIYKDYKSDDIVDALKIINNNRN